MYGQLWNRACTCLTFLNVSLIQQWTEIMGDFWFLKLTWLCVCVFWCPLHNEIKFQREACYVQYVSRKTSCFFLFSCAHISCWLSYCLSCRRVAEPGLSGVWPSLWDHQGSKMNGHDNVLVLSYCFLLLLLYKRDVRGLGGGGVAHV